MNFFNRYFSFFLCLFSLVSCGELVFDTSVAYPLLQISSTTTPETQEIRDFQQYGDLVYTAAGSGGILVYRIVGDEVRPENNLSITNLYSENLERVFVRTIEILETELTTNLIFSFDTIQGGGLGIAEITPSYTRPVGSLAGTPDLRIRKTVTTYNPEGYFSVLLADEQHGLLTYNLSFLSNSFFEQPKIATLIDTISRSDASSPLNFFSTLGAPTLRVITNITQISNLTTLLDLAVDEPDRFNSFITNIPFLSQEQQQQLRRLTEVQDRALLRSIVDSVKNVVDEAGAQEILSNPEAFESLFAIDPNALNIGNIPTLLQQLTVEDPLTTNLDISNVLASAGNRFLTLEETETLYAESLLSNKDILEGRDIQTETVHDPTVNAFTARTVIGNAATEIEKTIRAAGRRFFGEDVLGIKDQLYQFTQEELRMLFQTAFQQADLIAELVPILNDAGVNLQELYSFLENQQFFKVIDVLDASILNQILRLLPRYQINTELVLVKTNTVLSNIRGVEHDQRFLYIASGMNGFYIIDRVSGKIIDHKKKEFSDISMVVPHTLNQKKYYVVTDMLDGLIVYRRNKDNTIGEQVSRVALVGDGFAVYPFGNLLWVADGVNGVLGIRMNEDESLVIESETYEKQGIAYAIGSAQRREVLASYGSEGFRRYRLTNVLTKVEVQDSGTSGLDQVQRDENFDFIDSMLEWSRQSQIGIFLRNIFF